MAKREPAEISRRKILDAAARRFGELGYERTRVEDVARDVELGRSAVLYHFESKLRLYGVVLDDLYGGLYESQRTILQAAGPLGERIERSIAALIDSIARQPAIAQIALRNAGTTDVDEAKEVRDRALPFAQLIMDVVVSGAESAVEIDYRLLVSMIVGPILYYFAALPTLLGPQADDTLALERIRALHDAVTQNALRMLSPDSGRAESLK